MQSLTWIKSMKGTLLRWLTMYVTGPLPELVLPRR